MVVVVRKEEVKNLPNQKKEETDCEHDQSRVNDEPEIVLDQSKEKDDANHIENRDGKIETTNAARRNSHKMTKEHFNGHQTNDKPSQDHQINDHQTNEKPTKDSQANVHQTDDQQTNDQRSVSKPFFYIALIVVILIFIAAFLHYRKDDSYTTYDIDVFSGIDPAELERKQEEYIEAEKKHSSALNKLYEGFLYLMSWGDEGKSKNTGVAIKEIEDKLFLINFKKLQTKGHCNVFKGVHVKHYPTVVKNIAKMLNLPKAKEQSLLYAVNSLSEFEENFDSFNAEDKDGERLFGRFAVKKIDKEWVTMMYTIKSVRFVLSDMKDQGNKENITDLITFSQENGQVALSLKAEKFFAKYYNYEAQQHFNKKCKFLIPKNSKKEL